MATSQYGNISPDLLNQTQTSLGTALKGQLPADVQNLLRQQAAEYGVGTGMPGSQFAGYRGLRNLGLTSLDQINRAQSALTPFLTSPYQSQQLGLQGQAQQNQASQFSQQMSLDDQRRMDQLSIANQNASLEQQRINNQAAQHAAALAASRQAQQQRQPARSTPSMPSYGSSPLAAYGTGSGLGTYTSPTMTNSYSQPYNWGSYDLAPSYSTTPYYAAAPGSSYSPQSDPYGSYDTGIFDAFYNSFDDYGGGGGSYYSDVAPVGSGQYADYGDWGDAYY